MVTEANAARASEQQTTLSAETNAAYFNSSHSAAIARIPLK
jgi:hypothetical protein